MSNGEKGELASLNTMRPIDHTHLARYTLGNRPLELEVLQLFVGQAPETLGALECATDAKAWHVAAHTLKGSARAVGAWAVAAAAEAAERAGHVATAKDGLIAEVRRTVEEARAYIATLPSAA